MQTEDAARVRLDADDYDALLTLGYPSADEWAVGATGGNVKLLCPFTNRHVAVALLIKRCGRRERTAFLDGDPLNLTRHNLAVVKGKPIGTVHRARQSLKHAFANLQPST
ncbi:hypothetical protein FG93_03502 [Bosea sp. LC85]|uniref:hypothetical protein n=1 Tax=Bosea sp. LC85 TaxID=1502851 RepID=UPI0004E442C1|nr:hypothetical protein [Bosea sp. LC85]KFC68880.1 hypothetical protein FG93_03502 [Bosea sp. LC85]